MELITLFIIILFWQLKILYSIAAGQFLLEALIVILYHEKVNVSKTYFDKHNKLFMLCNSSDDLDAPFSPADASQDWRQWGFSHPSCLLATQQKVPSYSGNEMM